MTQDDTRDHDDADGLSRRGMLECMIWAGTGVLWTVVGGVPKSLSLLAYVGVAVAPGAIETQMLRGLFTEEQFSKDQTLDPAEVASVIADCVTGKLHHTSGEVIYIHRGR